MMEHIYKRALKILRNKEDFESEKNQKLMAFCKYKLEKGNKWIKGTNHKGIKWHCKDSVNNKTYAKLTFKQWLEFM
jgi:hypothetical protein